MLFTKSEPMPTDAVPTSLAQAPAVGTLQPLPATEAQAPFTRPLWALVDCNNFYASCETLFRPDLAHRPVVVLSNNDGCIVSRSATAKALGIPMGAPEFTVRDFLRRHGTTVFSSNYALYGDISARVMAVLERITGADVEQYSIDEAFIRLDGALRSHAEGLAQNIRETVQAWVGITVSVGIGSTRTLAKIAAHRAKTGNGICLLPEAPKTPDALTAPNTQNILNTQNTPGPLDATNATSALDALLHALPVGDVWGIGHRQMQTLYAVGITNALGLKQANDHWLRKHLTVTGWKTALELRGIPCIGEGEGPTPRRTLCSSRSFGHTVRDHASLAQAVALFTARAAARLRREGLTAGALRVHIRTGHNATRQRCELAGQRAFSPTADTRTLAAIARSILAGIYTEGPAYAKAGIALLDLAPVGKRQANLLDCCTPNDAARAQKEAKRSKALMHALDIVNRKFGNRALHFGAEGPESAPWHMRSEHCSPRLTTHWGELPLAICR